MLLVKYTIHNKLFENVKICKMPENWDSKRKISQKDTDARWTKKRNVVHYGYKDHIKIDKESKIIMNDALKIRSIEIKKAEFSVGLTNLVYNLKIKMGFFFKLSVYFLL